MGTYDNEVVTLSSSYTAEDHQTWNKLCTRQIQLVKDVACRAFFEGFPKLDLDLTRLPERDQVSARIQRMSGWTLGDAQNEYLGPTDWFDHLAESRFPVTDYIRRPDELDFTPLPDLFHEYFGHLAFFTDRHFGDIARRYGEVYQLAKNETQQLAISRLWWYSIEFGFIVEDGEQRVLGAGLLSSPGELLHALSGGAPRYPFDINRVAATPGAAYSFHEQYFIVDSIEHLRRIIDDYAVQEGLIDAG
jgi:phenylalanine-4-hydroxylase